MATVTPRNSLIPVAAALYRCNLEEAKQEMSKVPEADRNQVYGKLWEVCGQPNESQFGERAFQDSSTSFMNKLDAVERVISAQVASQIIGVPRRLIQQGAKSVTYERHYDGGVDYRFNEEGYSYLDPTKSFWRRPIGAIQDLFAYMMFILRTSFCRDPEVKKIRSLILKCAASERVLSSYTYKGLVQSHTKYPIAWIQQLEHDFFEDLSALYKALIPDTNHPDRLFPSEMLRTIHDINKPERQEHQAIEAKPGWINGDLACSLDPFLRLHDPSAVFVAQGASSNDREKVNREHSINHRFAPHYIFIDATQDARAELKTAVRNIRQTLGEVTIGKKSIEDLRKELITFKETWDAFIKSHEVLGEAQSYLSQNDFYAPVYDKARQERASFSLWGRKKINHQALNNAARTRVEEVYLCGQPLTPTGQIFQELKNRTQRQTH